MPSMLRRSFPKYRRGHISSEIVPLSSAPYTYFNCVSCLQ
jgi:hypothetical protein